MRPGVALVIWLALVVLAVANGAVGQGLVEPAAGEWVSHLYQSVVMILLVLLASWIYARLTHGPRWLGAALLTGLMWAGLTVLFEFGFGHYVIGTPWEELLTDYRLWAGRLWALVLLALLLGPVVMGGLVNPTVRPKQSAEK